jgi:hypothetical protein
MSAVSSSTGPSFQVEIDINDTDTSTGDDPVDVNQLLFHAPLTELIDHGPNGTVEDYLHIWKNSFKSNKEFLDHVLRPILAEHSLKTHDYLEHSKAVQLGEQLAKKLLATFVTSHEQKSREVFDEITQIQKEDRKFPQIQKAFDAIHNHRERAYCEQKNPNHQFSTLDVKELHTYQLLAHRFAYNVMTRKKKR